MSLEVSRGVKAVPYDGIPWWALRAPVISLSVWIHVTISVVISAPCPCACLLVPITALGQYRTLLFWTSPLLMETPSHAPPELPPKFKSVHSTQVRKRPWSPGSASKGLEFSAGCF